MKVHGHKVIDWIAGSNGERLALLAWENQPQNFCNLVKIDAAGELLWTVQPVHPLEGAYGSIEFRGGRLTGHNLAGYAETIDYLTGKILQRVFTK